MLAFFLSPLGRKIALYSALAVGAFFAYRWWSNRVWEKGYDEGKKAGIEEIEAAKQKEWAAKEDGLRQAAALNLQEQTQAERDLRAAQAARQDARKTLDAILAESKGRLQATHAIAQSISADAIDDALRRLSAELGPPDTR